jgi:pilus assembly protein CpaB
MTRIFRSRLATMFVALLLAIGAAAAVAIYVARYQSDVNKQQNTVSVLVAAKDIPAGTSGADVVNKGYVKTVKVQIAALAPTAIQSTNQLSGRVASQTVYAGAQLLNEAFPQQPNNLTSLAVKGAYRAVEVPVDQTRGLVGTLKAGDHVDIAATFTVQQLQQVSGNSTTSTLPQNAQVQVTVTLLRNISVLRSPAVQSSSATGVSSGASGAPSSDTPEYATLALTDADAQKLVFALENGKIWLTLRGDRALDSYTNSPNKTIVTTLGSMIAGLKGYTIVSPQATQPAGQTSTGTPSGN